MNAVKTAKVALRKEIKKIINGLSSDEKARQSKLVQEKLFQHQAYQGSKRLSIFLSMTDEVDTEPILRHALQAGKACFIPRYDSKSSYMDMVRLSSWEEYENLPVTSWNIKQPPIGQECETALATGGLDLILMPGLAFTKNGLRLGRGRGYYDRFLTKCCESQNPAPLTLALVYSEQLVESVPTEDTDRPVDHIITAL